MFRVNDTVLWHRTVGNNWRTRSKSLVVVVKLGPERATVRPQDSEKTIRVAYHNLERIKREGGAA